MAGWLGGLVGFLMLAASAAFAAGGPPPLSEAEADREVAREAAEREAAEAARKRALESAPKQRSRTVRNGGREVRINRVTRAPERAARTPARGRSGRNAGARGPAETSGTEAAASPPDPPAEYRRIVLSATVYDGDYTEIRWRHPDGSGATETVWTNVNLNHLRPVGGFRRGGVRYDYFGFVRSVSKQEERERLARARERDARAESRRKDAPVAFGDGPEYVVIAERADAPVPAELYQQMDALLGHCMANAERLKRDYRRRRALAEARERYRAANPPEPKDIVINHWPAPGTDGE